MSIKANRRICVVIGSRAEYGHLYWVMKKIQQSPILDLQITVIGAMLSPAFGRAVDQLVADGFKVSAEIEMTVSGDSACCISKSMGLGIIGFADVIDRLQPDLLLILGDRFEMLGIAGTAMIAEVPIAHIHGGEATEGLIDEAVRHALSKMSHIHLTCAEPYRQRVIQLGEQPKHVHNVGAPGLDHLDHIDIVSRRELSSFLQQPLKGDLILVTYHPVTLQTQHAETSINTLLEAVDTLSNATIIFTGVNQDTAHEAVTSRIKEFVEARPDNAGYYSSLGQLRYLSAMHHAAVVVGNSSSGIIEAPAVGVPTVNIGARQKGRLAAESVITCPEEKSAIIASLEKAMSAKFQSLASKKETPYGKGGSANKIVDILERTDLTNILLKPFCDLGLKCE